MFFDQKGLEYFFLLAYQHEGKTLLSQIHYIIQWKQVVKTRGSMTIYIKKRKRKNKEDGYLVWNEGRKRESSLMQQIFNQDYYGKCIMSSEGYFQVSWRINVW